MGGSPCQGFSFAGKQLNFDDPRSALFFEFVRLLKECKPDYFLLENVMMKKEFKDIITEHLGVEPVMINSSLVSAQNRKRLYWTNIPGVGQPEDKGEALQNVLEREVNESFYPGKNLLDKYDGGSQLNPSYKSQANTVHKGDKSPTICAGTHGYAIGYIEQRPIVQPEDKGILLKDVLEDFVGDRHSELEKHILSGKTVEKITRHNNRIVKEQSNPDKSAAIHAGYYKMGGRDQQYLIDREPKVCGRIIGRKINPETGKRDDYNPKLKRKKRIEARLDEKSGTLTTVQTDNVLIVSEATKKGYTEIEDGDCFDATFMSSKTRRGRNMKDKSNCLTAANYDYMRYEHPTYRKLTPVECERLQTLPDNYTEGVSNTQRYKALGNGWTVDVIVHILQGLKWQS